MSHPDLGDPDANVLHSIRLGEIEREMLEAQHRRAAATLPAQTAARCACGGQYKKGRLETKRARVSALRCEGCGETYLSARVLIELLQEPFDEDD